MYRLDSDGTDADTRLFSSIHLIPFLINSNFLLCFPWQPFISNTWSTCWNKVPATSVTKTSFPPPTIGDEHRVRFPFLWVNCFSPSLFIWFIYCSKASSSSKRRERRNRRLSFDFRFFSFFPIIQKETCNQKVIKRRTVRAWNAIKKGDANFTAKPFATTTTQTEVDAFVGHFTAMFSGLWALFVCFPRTVVLFIENNRFNP